MFISIKLKGTFLWKNRSFQVSSEMANVKYAESNPYERVQIETLINFQNPFAWSATLKNLDFVTWKNVTWNKQVFIFRPGFDSVCRPQAFSVFLMFFSLISVFWVVSEVSYWKTPYRGAY